jgi:putative inorganic carbon (HCO3(-)) transporter
VAFLNSSSFDRSHALVIALIPVGIYLMFAPVWLPGIAVRPYDDARVLELSLLACMVVLLLWPPFAASVTHSWLALPPASRGLIVILLAGGAISTALSQSPKLGVLEVAITVELLVLALFVSEAIRSGGQHAETLLAIALSAGASLFVLKFCVTYVLYVLEGKDFPWLTPFLDFANVRFFSQYQSYSLLLIVLPVVLLPLAKAWRMLVYFFASLFWALQWTLGTRAVWMGFVVATLAVLAFGREGRAVWLRMQGLPLVLGGVMYLLFSYVIGLLPSATPVPDKVGHIIERSHDSVLERFALWKSAWTLIRERPLLGAGPGQFGLQDYAMNAAHPHNTPLQLLSEYGVVAGLAGIGLGLSLLALAIATLRGHCTSGPDRIRTSLAAALIMGLTDSLFSGNVLMPLSQVMLCVVAGWLVARTMAPDTPLRPANWSGRLVQAAMVSLALLALIVTTVLAIRYLHVAADIGAFKERGNPHFWHYGRFNGW